MLPGTRRAFVALAAGQVIMVGVMTAAPLHLHMQGSGTGLIGAILSAHTFGMFAFSPLTAALTERFGAPWVAASGLAVLALASTAGAVTVGSGLTLPLLVLGYGWNLCFIAGSATLAAGTDPAGRLSPWKDGSTPSSGRSPRSPACCQPCCCRRAAPASLPGVAVVGAAAAASYGMWSPAPTSRGGGGPDRVPGQRSADHAGH